MNFDGRKPGAAFWATVVVVIALVGYPLSVGPACWLSSRMNYGASTVSSVYRPLTWATARSERFADAVAWYSRIGSAGGWSWWGGTWVDADRLLRPWLHRPKLMKTHFGVGGSASVPAEEI